jgi:ribonuclease P protein component
VRIVSLRQKSDFLRLKESKKKFFISSAVIVVANTPQVPEDDFSDSIRVGFIVTKKIGGAVQRNRARRRLKAAFRKASGLYSVVGLDIIFIARSGALSVKFAEMVENIAQLLLKLKLEHENN